MAAIKALFCSRFLFWDIDSEGSQIAHSALQSVKYVGVLSKFKTLQNSSN